MKRSDFCVLPSRAPRRGCRRSSWLRRSRRSPIGLAVLVFLLSALFLGLAHPAVARDRQASTRWSTLIRKHGFSKRQVGLVIIDMAGNTQANIRGNVALVPASNQKVLISAVALKYLGVDFRYKTVLWSTTPPRGDLLPGDLVVSGGGDPNISGRFTGGDPTAIFRSWAREFRNKGIRRVAGDLLVDDFAFDDQRFLSTWKENQWSRWYSAEISALTFNDNCVDVTVLPASVGSLAGFRLSPATAYVNIENRCKTVPLSRVTRSPRIGLERKRGTNEILVKGKIAKRRGGEWTGSVTVDDPGLYFGTVLKEIFSLEGIVIEGTVVRDRDRLPSSDNRVVYHRHSSPLSLDIPVILGSSQNLHAELLLKALGHASGETGSVKRGAAVIRRQLRKEGIPIDGLEIADGSGFSPANRVAPATLARLLYANKREPFFQLFCDSLPVGGKSGTLRKRFRKRSLRGRVLAKTGYIKGVSALSGYVFRTEREPVKSSEARAVPASSSNELLARSSRERFWTFSLLINGFPRKKGLVAAFELQEDIVREILNRMKK